MNAITRNEIARLDAPVIEFTLNGQPVTARASETIIEVADREGVPIPRLCYKLGMDTAGNCRACMVEIEGESMRPVTWVTIDEVESGEWGIGGKALTTQDVRDLQRTAVG